MKMIRSVVVKLLVTGIIAVGTLHARGGKVHYFGPTGLSGSLADRTIKVTAVEKGSPADGKIEPGAVVVGAGGENFKDNVRMEMAEAIDAAETKAAGGKLTLVLDDDKTVDLQLQVLGSYSATAPYNCPKTDAIIRQAAEHILKRKNAARLKTDMLGLLATGEKKYIDAVREQVHAADWAKPDREKMEGELTSWGNMGLVTWGWGYTLILLGEYYLLTGDDYVLPAIEDYAVILAKGQDAGGLWGHRLISSRRNGRLPGYAQINQPSLTCLMGMLLAKKCGIENPDLEKGIATTIAFYESFIGRGALNYGVHPPNPNLWSNNGTSGSAAVDMLFAGNPQGASFFGRLSAANHQSRNIETGHTGHFFNVLWTPLGANVLGPEVTTLFAKKSRWLHTLYRAWDGRFTFDGGRYKGGDSTGSHLLAYCLGRRKLLITGRDADESIWLKGQAAVDAVELSEMEYADKTIDELLELVNHPIPQVRWRANRVLVDREDLKPRIAAFLEKGTKYEKLMAMEYVDHLTPVEARLPYLDSIGAMLRDTDEDPWVRASAAASLASIGEPAQKYYMDMVRTVLEERPWDRFGEIDALLSMSLVKLCPNALEAGLVSDKDLFYKAVLDLSNNKRQHVRGHAMRMLAGMPVEDFHRVADTVLYLVEDTDPTYHSYHSASSPATGIMVLADLGIAEGIPLALDIPKNPSGKVAFKMKAMWRALTAYGANAKEALKTLQDSYEGRTNFGRHTGAYNAMVKAIEEDENPEPLISIEEAKRAEKK